MNATDVLTAILHARDKGENPALILDENSPLVDAAREALKPSLPPAAEKQDERAGGVIGWRDRKYVDCTPWLHVGSSAFEDWYQAHPKACTGDKQLARDAYAAGMGDPLVAESLREAGEPSLRGTLAELDTRLRECMALGLSAVEAYDSFYQENVSAALKGMS